MSFFGRREERGDFRVEQIGADSIAIQLDFVPSRVFAEFVHHHHHHPSCHPHSTDRVQAAIQGSAIFITWNVATPREIRWIAHK